MILPRLISTALRVYTTSPVSRDAAATNLLINAIRLAVHHLGRQRTAALVLEVFEYHKDRAA